MDRGQGEPVFGEMVNAFCDGREVVPVVHRRDPRPPQSACAARRGGRGRGLWTHGGDR